VVKRLRAAGAVILGKLQLTEGAYAERHAVERPAVAAGIQLRVSGAGGREGTLGHHAGVAPTRRPPPA
jgi:hypothetical protein